VAGASLLPRALGPLGRVLDFRGRSRRADFWPYMVLLFGLYLAGVIAVVGIGSLAMGSMVTPMYLLTGALALLAVAATVRRLHDVGWSGWWVGAYVLMMLGFIVFFFYWRYVLIPATPFGEPGAMFRLAPLFIAFSAVMNGLGLWVLILCLLDGMPGANRHGPDPKGRSAP